jgi:4-hydroxyphenylacetate 3-monooxygenase
MSPRVEATARGRAESVGAPGTMDGARYIESLRDGREVWLHGERVADVTQHPAFRNVVATFAGLYDLQHQAGTQEVMTYLDPDGVRGSVSYLPPTSPDELLRRRADVTMTIDNHATSSPL